MPAGFQATKSVLQLLGTHLAGLPEAVLKGSDQLQCKRAPERQPMRSSKSHPEYFYTDGWNSKPIGPPFHCVFIPSVASQLLS